MKKIFLLMFCMLIYMPGAFASTWQEDVDAAASDPKKIYEVYRGMPYADFEKPGQMFRIGKSKTRSRDGKCSRRTLKGRSLCAKSS